MRRFLCGSGGYNRDDTSGHVVTWDTHARVRLSAPNSTTSAAPPEFAVHTVTRAHIPAHGTARGRQPRFACTSRRALRQRTDSNIAHAASDTQWLSLLERPAVVRTHGGRCPVAWPSTNVAIRFVRRPMASKDSVDAQVLKAAAPCTTAPPRGIHRLACAHPYARTRSWPRPRLTWHELDKSKYAPIAKWVHAGG